MRSITACAVTAAAVRGLASIGRIGVNAAPGAGTMKSRLEHSLTLKPYSIRFATCSRPPCNSTKWLTFPSVPFSKVIVIPP